MLIYEQRSSEQQTLKNPPFYCNRGRKIQKMDFPVSGSFLLLFGEWEAHQGNIVLRKVCSHVSHFLCVAYWICRLLLWWLCSTNNMLLIECMWMKLFIPWKRKQHWFWRSGKFSLVCFFYFSVQFACMYICNRKQKEMSKPFPVMHSSSNEKKNETKTETTE